MALENLKLLSDAVARNAAAVVSLQSSSLWHHHKSRFLAQFEDGLLLLESPTGQETHLEDLVSIHGVCAVTFRQGTHKVMFTSPLREIARSWQFNQGIKIAAIAIDPPLKIISVQRRANYRCKLPLNSGIAMRVWRLADREYIKVQPASTREIKVELRDLSAGGAGILLLGPTGDSSNIQPGERLRVQLSWGKEKLVIEARARKMNRAKGDDQPVITGVSFKRLDDDLEGRRTQATLTRLVAELQRDEVRRTRDSMLDESRSVN